MIGLNLMFDIRFKVTIGSAVGMSVCTKDEKSDGFDAKLLINSFLIKAFSPRRMSPAGIRKAFVESESFRLVFA